MQRDLHLIRDIVLQVWHSELGGTLSEFRLSGYAQEIIPHHIAMAEEVGFITRDGNGNLCMAWGGHEFVQLFQADALWHSIMVQLESINCTSYELAKQLAITYIANGQHATNDS